MAAETPNQIFGRAWSFKPRHALRMRMAGPASTRRSTAPIEARIEFGSMPKRIGSPKTS